MKFWHFSGKNVSFLKIEIFQNLESAKWAVHTLKMIKKHNLLVSISRKILLVQNFLHLHTVLETDDKGIS